MESYIPNHYSFSEEAPIEAMPAGDYFIIDPCYALQGIGQFWDDYCKFCFPASGENRDPVWMHIDGHVFPAFSTAYGDGVYPVIHDDGAGEAGVDSGTLALIPSEIVPDEEKGLGVKVHLSRPFSATFPETGVAAFDHVFVSTKGAEVPEED